jgi:hypothetical protein
VKRRTLLYECVHLARLTGTYPETTAAVGALLRRPGLEEARLVVDATAAGWPVVDAMRAAGLRLTPVLLGDGVAWRDLVVGLVLALQQDRLRIAAALPLTPALVSGLQGLRVEDGSGPHADLVAALAVAAWWGERSPVMRAEDFADFRAR